MAQVEMDIISQDDILKEVGIQVPELLEEIKDSMKMFANNEIVFPEKTVQIFDETTQERINILPASILSKRISGVKSVAVFPENPRKFDRQNLTATIILNEIQHGYPIAFMDGTLISNLRTAMTTALAASYLAPKNPTKIGIIGSGEQAKMHLYILKSLFPSLKVCHVSSRRTSSEESFVRIMKNVVKGMEIKGTQNDFSKAINGADIIITATSAQAPLLKAQWIKEGAFYGHVGGWEDEFEVALKADKIVCDDWNAVKHRTQTLSRMYKEGIIQDSDVYGNLHEIVNGKKDGRTSSKEFIYFNTVGLSFLDVVLANYYYEKLKAKGFNRKFLLQSDDLFQAISKNLNSK